MFPATAKLDASRSISLDAAVIAYYDVGVNFGQNLYVPLYIAHGFGHSTTGEDVQVLSFFPVVSSDDLIRHGVVHAVPVSGAESTQQQGTLGFATPTPHAPPGVPLNNPNAGIGGPGCPGGVIDYMVSCSVGGKLMCRGTFTTASTYDPMLACFASCRSHQAVVDTAGGRNPCDAFIKDSGIDATRINGTVPTQQLAPSGSVTCVINACPS